MSLQSLFEDKVEVIREFMGTPNKSMLVVQRDADGDELLRRVLVRIEGDDEDPNVMVPLEIPFFDPDLYFEYSLRDIHARNEQFREALEREGVELPALPDDPDLSPLERFERYLSGVAECLPDTIGSYVVIVDPDSVHEPETFRDTFASLADLTDSPWAKFLVLDSVENPLLANLDAEADLAAVHTFRVTPDDIEGEVQEMLKQPGSLSPVEMRQCVAILAGFAFGRREYERARAHQEQWVALTEADGTSAESANAKYNLANTHVAQGELEGAEPLYVEAAELCLESDLNNLLALVLTNLGITYSQLGRYEEALASLQIARDTFRALEQPPGEAHVLDCMASVHRQRGDDGAAEDCWLEALAIFDSVSNELLQEVRAGGSADIRSKLEAFYRETGQESKIGRLDAE